MSPLAFSVPVGPPTRVPNFAAPSTERHHRLSPRISSKKTLHRIHVRAPPPTARILPLPTGTNMEVLDDPHVGGTLPSPNRPVVIFVHGAMHAAWSFHLFQPFFAARGFQTHAVSLRGSGATDHPGQTALCTLDQHLTDLRALFDAVSPERPVLLIAHSLGGWICQKLVETTPEPHRVAALVLLAAAPRSVSDAAAAEIVKLAEQATSAAPPPPPPTGTDMEVRRRAFDLPMRKSALMDRGVARDVAQCRFVFFSPESMEGYDEDVEGDAVLQGYMPRFDTTKLQTDFRTLQPAVQARGDGHVPPVLVVSGDLDVMQDRASLDACVDMWGGQALWVRNAPHDLMLYSQWREVATEIADWLDKCLGMDVARKDE